MKPNATRFNRLQQQAALCWEKGNNSGDDKILSMYLKHCEHFREEAERLLPPGCTVDYPGLYPVVTRNGREYYGEITNALWID